MCTLDNSRMPYKPNSRNPLMKMLTSHLLPLIMTIKPRSRGNRSHIDMMYQNHHHTTAMFRQYSRRKGSRAIPAAP